MTSKQMPDDLLILRRTAFHSPYTLFIVLSRDLMRPAQEGVLGFP